MPMNGLFYDNHITRPITFDYLLQFFVYAAQYIFTFNALMQPYYGLTLSINEYR